MRVKHADSPYQKMILIYPENDEETKLLKEYGDLKFGVIDKYTGRLQISIDRLMEFMYNLKIWGIQFDEDET
jgi:hypothetical protein